MKTYLFSIIAVFIISACAPYVGYQSAVNSAGPSPSIWNVQTIVESGLGYNPIFNPVGDDKVRVKRPVPGMISKGLLGQQQIEGWVICYEVSKMMPDGQYAPGKEGYLGVVNGRVVDKNSFSMSLQYCKNSSWIN